MRNHNPQHCIQNHNHLNYKSDHHRPCERIPYNHPPSGTTQTITTSSIANQTITNHMNFIPYNHLPSGFGDISSIIRNSRLLRMTPPTRATAASAAAASFNCTVQHASSHVAAGQPNMPTPHRQAPGKWYSSQDVVTPLVRRRLSSRQRQVWIKNQKVGVIPLFSTRQRRPFDRCSSDLINAHLRIRNGPARE